MAIIFSVVEGTWAIVRLSATAPMPDWAFASSPFVSITRTADELSIVCPAAAVPIGVPAVTDWALFKLHGPFDFNQVGILESVASPLARAKVSLLAVGTFDTDYILVKAGQARLACDVLIDAGHRLSEEPALKKQD